MNDHVSLKFSSVAASRWHFTCIELRKKISTEKIRNDMRADLETFAWSNGIVRFDESRNEFHIMTRTSVKLYLSCNRCDKSFILPQEHLEVRRVLNKSVRPNKRLYYSRYLWLLISPRNPNVFFLTICTPPSSSGSCAIPRYPENKQYVVCKSNIFAIAIFISSYCVQEIIIEIMCLGWKIIAQLIFIILYYRFFRIFLNIET